METAVAMGLNNRRSAEIAKPAIYNEETFQFFLELDKKRAVRSGRSFLLLLVEGKETESLSEGSDRLFEALRRSLRETDYVGWYRANRVVGAVLTYTGEQACSDVCLAVRKRATDALDELPSGTERSFDIDVVQLTARQPKITSLWP